MKKIAGVAAGVTAALLMASPGFPADSMQQPTATEKPGKLAMSHSVTGSVVSVDESARTFTVQDAKGKDYVLTTDPALGSQMSDVKAGGRVKVSYKKNSSGQMIATKIASAETMKTR